MALDGEDGEQRAVVSRPLSVVRCKGRIEHRVKRQITEGKGYGAQGNGETEMGRNGDAERIKLRVSGR